MIAQKRPYDAVTEVCLRKRLFLTEEDALVAIARTRKRDPTAPPLYVYRCRVCNAFHRTKEPRR